MALMSLAARTAALLCPTYPIPATLTMPAPDRPSLAIVAPRALIDALADFVRYKSENYTVTLLELEPILTDTSSSPSSSATDDPEKLKRRLYDEWKRDPALSVLLVGDADVLPVRYMVLDRNTDPAFHYAFYPSDLYYADLAKDDGSFDDWNAAKDSFHATYFGEVRGEHNKSDPMNYDQVSYIPEIPLGRWPVSTPEQVRAVAAKSIAYDTRVRAESAKPRAAAVMVGGWVDARSTLNAFASSLAPRFDTTRLFYQDGNETWKDLQPPTAANVIAQFAAPTSPASSPATPPANPPATSIPAGLTGPASGISSGAAVGIKVDTAIASGPAPLRLVLHSGHGSDDSWDQCISVHDIPAFKDAPAAVFMSAGCSTARFATLPPYEPYEDTAGIKHAGTNHGEIFSAPPPPPAVYAKGDFNRTGLGEQLLLAPSGGAVVYIGCNTGSQPAALTLMAGFVNAADTLPTNSSGVLTAGECWKHAVTQYVARERLRDLKPTEDWYPASIFFQGMKFMFFGDPTAPLVKH